MIAYNDYVVQLFRLWNYEKGEVSSNCGLSSKELTKRLSTGFHYKYCPVWECRRNIREA